MPERLDPKVDVVFKRVFGAEENIPILISFLNAVLGWTGDQRIVAVEIKNPYLDLENIDDSLGILDIKVQLENKDLVDVEMQMSNRGNMERRSTYYICRMFGDQNIVGGRYQDLNRVIAINVLDFVRIKAIERYHTMFRLRETKENVDLTDAIEMHFIELPKLQEEMANHGNPLDRWAMFLKGWDNMELLDKLAKEDPAIGKAKKVLEEMAADPKAREIYELRRKAILDRNSEIYEAKMEGMAEGETKGELKGKLEAARNALLEGLELQTVAKITGLPLETIQKIKAEILS